MNVVHGLHFDNLRGDLFGGITAAVVALPLALAFGVASGAGPVAGLYGAIFVGLFAALFGGTPSQVSGPTGPMTVVMAGVITQYAHNPSLAFTVVMMGGLLQILFGYLRLGRYVSLVPLPVVSGFMTGIGVIIIILQLPVLLGHSTPGGGTLGTLAALPQLLTHPQWQAVLLALGALAIVYFMPARINRLLPSPLVALFVGTLAAFFVLTEAPVLGEIPSGFPQPKLPSFELAQLPGMVSSALVLALLGSIDSLLTSLVADSMTRTQHESDRELIGQGIGNTIAGMMGAIPGAGATMRTVINIRSGGLTPISGAVHALVLLAVVLGLGSLASHIPHAVLAGILIKVGIDILDRDYLKRVRHAPRSGVVVMMTVLLLTVFVDLITAVAVGVVMKSVMFVQRMSELQAENMRAVMGTMREAPLTAAETEIFDRAQGRIALFHISGPLSFGAVKEMASRLARTDQFDVLLIDLDAVPLIDSTAALGIEDVLKRARLSGKHVLLVGLQAKAARVMNRLGVLKHLPKGHRFQRRLNALRKAEQLLGIAPQQADPPLPSDNTKAPAESDPSV